MHNKQGEMKVANLLGACLVGEGESAGGRTALAAGRPGVLGPRGPLLVVDKQLLPRRNVPRCLEDHLFIQMHIPGIPAGTGVVYQLDGTRQMVCLPVEPHTREHLLGRSLKQAFQVCLLTKGGSGQNVKPLHMQRNNCLPYNAPESGSGSRKCCPPW